MALINCPERSAQVSDKAINCQNCGYQLRKPKRGVVGGLIKGNYIRGCTNIKMHLLNT